MFSRLINSKVSLKLNIFSNLFGSLWNAALGILFVPIYLRYVGVEAYGIIGFFTSLQTVFYILDFGLSPTFNREVAQLSVSESEEAKSEIKSLTKTLEIVNLLITSIAAIVLVSLSPLMANYWVQPETLSVRTVTICFIIMSISFAFQFPSNLYGNGLAGLHKQLTVNILNVLFGTLRSIGAFLVLALISPTIQAFLIWQTLIAFLQTFVTAFVFHKNLPKVNSKAIFKFNLIKRLWKFAAGNTGINLIALILMQLDKIIISKIISLEEFGYYSLVTTVASMSLAMLVSSVHKVSYPQFSSLLPLQDKTLLISAYHKNSQLVSVLLIPTTLILAFFSWEILYLWTRNEVIADKTSLLLCLYSIATGFHCLLWVPYGMQLAHGWTRLTFFKDLAAIIVFVPLLIILIYQYGIIGGAISWIIINFFSFVIYMWLMHKKILQGELARWYKSDVGLPFISSLIVVFVAKILLGKLDSLLSIFLSLSIVSLAAFGAAAFSASLIKPVIFEYISKIFSSRINPVSLKSK